jgi:hypothetical protein
MYIHNITHSVHYVNARSCNKDKPVPNCMEGYDSLLCSGWQGNFFASLPTLIISLTAESIFFVKNYKRFKNREDPSTINLLMDEYNTYTNCLAVVCIDRLTDREQKEFRTEGLQAIKNKELAYAMVTYQLETRNALSPTASTRHSLRFIEQTREEAIRTLENRLAVPVLPKKEEADDDNPFDLLSRSFKAMANKNICRKIGIQRTPIGCAVKHFFDWGRPELISLITDTAWLLIIKVFTCWDRGWRNVNIDITYNNNIRHYINETVTNRALKLWSDYCVDDDVIGKVKDKKAIVRRIQVGLLYGKDNRDTIKYPCSIGRDLFGFNIATIFTSVLVGGIVSTIIMVPAIYVSCEAEIKKTQGTMTDSRFNKGFRLRGYDEDMISDHDAVSTHTYCKSSIVIPAKFISAMVSAAVIGAIFHFMEDALVCSYQCAITISSLQNHSRFKSLYSKNHYELSTGLILYHFVGHFLHQATLNEISYSSGMQ